jgi:hypothetical protein
MSKDKMMASEHRLVKRMGLRPHVVKNLLVDEVVRIGLGSLSAVSDTHGETKKEDEGGAHG